MSIFDPNILALLEAQANCGKVFVYIADMDQWVNHLFPFWKCLSNSEQEKATKYYTKLFTDRYIIAHGLLRHILSYYTKQSPKNMCPFHNFA